MAHKGVWYPGSWKVKDALKKGEFVTFDSVAGQLVKAGTDLAKPAAVAVSDHEAGDLFDGHWAEPPSEIIEVLAVGAIAAQAEVCADGDGLAREFDEANDGEAYIVGRAITSAAAGDIFELQIAPRYDAS